MGDACEDTRVRMRALALYEDIAGPYRLDGRG